MTNEKTKKQGKYKLLIVDDEQGMTDMLEYELRQHGFDVTTANNGEDASVEIGRGEYDLIISDVKMPKLGGLELLKKAKAADPDAVVLITTGFGTVEMAEECKKEGAFGFINKPYNLDELLDYVNKALETRKSGKNRGK